jgi:hypothetical protein
VEDDFDKKCIELSYRLTVPTAEFDVERFAKELARFSESDDWKSVVLGPRSKNASGFHAHVYWRQDRKKSSDTQLQVDFHRWTSKKKAIAEIHAEDFYAWTKQFLKTSTAKIHIHAEYVLPVTAWQSKVMPLPMKIPYGGKSAVVDGISIEFSTEPEGVHGAFIQLTKDAIEVQLFASRPIEFSSFNIDDDIEAFTSVVKTIVEEKSS